MSWSWLISVNNLRYLVCSFNTYFKSFSFFCSLQKLFLELHFLESVLSLTFIFFFRGSYYLYFRTSLPFFSIYHFFSNSFYLFLHFFLIFKIFLLFISGFSQGIIHVFICSCVTTS